MAIFRGALTAVYSCCHPSAATHPLPADTTEPLPSPLPFRLDRMPPSLAVLGGPRLPRWRGTSRCGLGGGSLQRREECKARSLAEWINRLILMTFVARLKEELVWGLSTAISRLN